MDNSNQVSQTLLAGGDAPTQRKRPLRIKHRNMKVTDLLPMTTHPAIVPHVGRLLDMLGRKLAKTRWIGAMCWPFQSIIGLKLVWRYVVAPLRSLLRRLVPANMFWASVVPSEIQATVHVVVNDEGRPVDCCIWVYDGWPQLWRGGAFGKGILSRSDATWEHRYRRDTTQNSQGAMYLEDITQQRRQERIQADNRSNVNDLDVAQEELPLMEPFQLSPYEALFLSELGCIKAVDGASGLQYTYADLWRTLQAVSNDDDEFELRYAAYYYYRAKGWVVRSGIKFGSDFLLYKSGGPSKSHSLYSAIVRRFDSATMDGQKSHLSLDETWQYMFALSRVTSQAQKSLLVCYVDPPPAGADSGGDMHEHVKAGPPDLHQFGVQEFVVQRFNPNKK
ncbi:tRNA splicing endonuclease subunit sen2 [Coemansia sp. RSA 1933]|nr:tRNA splicing endonuclease subunit sen2 [Coemansia sp. RSA 1933]